jgi:nucleoside-diphosphate-sugar epimerase
MLPAFGRRYAPGCIPSPLRGSRCFVVWHTLQLPATNVCMKVLFIGGTGIISTASTELAVKRGIELTLITRGHHAGGHLQGAKTLRVDMHDVAAAKQALNGLEFDAIVDWIAFTPADIERDLELFRGRTRQFVFISSASCYQKPSTHYLMTESTPLANPHWQYSRDKIACEDRLMKAYREEGFPVTIVRPSLTYGDTQIPLVTNSWEKPYTIVDRMLKGKKVVVPGDGTSFWVITHNSDFAKGLVGLLGHPQAIGHAFQITSEEVMTWDQYYRIVAQALGVEAHIVHIPSDFIVACWPELVGTLIGDKSVSVVFDNSKLKRSVPDYCPTTRFAEGIRRTIAWFQADPVRQIVDDEANEKWDLMIEAYERGLKTAVEAFQSGRGTNH